MVYEDLCRGGNTVNIKTIYQIVGDINEFYREKTQKFDEFLVEIHSNGEGIVIIVLGDQIWYSEDDNRPFINGEENYIPLETHIIDKIIQIIEDLNKLAFK